MFLLLHGFPSSSHQYRGLIERLSDKYHVIAPDLPGFGFSDYKNDPFFLPAGAEAFRRDIPEAEIRFVDAGHFVLETHLDEVAQIIGAFLARTLDAEQGSALFGELNMDSVPANGKELVAGMAGVLESGSLLENTEATEIEIVNLWRMQLARVFAVNCVGNERSVQKERPHAGSLGCEGKSGDR